MRLRAWIVIFAFVAPARAQGEWGVAYAPSDTRGPRPAIVYLHGMWASPEDSCPVFAPAATAFGFLVCPRGNAPLDDGKMWRGTAADAEKQIAPALTAADALAPGMLDRAGRGTMIGYSNGAYFAAEVACTEPGRWPGLILMSMKLDLNAARLRAAGIERVLLAAGEHDGARTSLEALASRLQAEGVRARFMSLGPGGHEFPSDMSSRMCAAIAWVRGADERLCAPRP